VALIAGAAFFFYLSFVKTWFWKTETSW